MFKSKIVCPKVSAAFNRLPLVKFYRTKNTLSFRCQVKYAFNCTRNVMNFTSRRAFNELKSNIILENIAFVFVFIHGRRNGLTCPLLRGMILCFRKSFFLFWNRENFRRDQLWISIQCMQIVAISRSHLLLSLWHCCLKWNLKRFWHDFCATQKILYKLVQNTIFVINLGCDFGAKGFLNQIKVFKFARLLSYFVLKWVSEK